MTRKRAVIESKALRDSARGEECTVEIMGICLHDPETTVLAHLPSEFKHTKPSDLSSCYACDACHAVIDRRRDAPFFEQERDWYLRRAMVRTWTRFVEKGLIQVKGHE